MKTFAAIAGQSLYDVCLQTYGDLAYLFKLMQDNGITGLNNDVFSGQKFIWDETLVVDQQINSAFAANDKYYSTTVDAGGSVFFVDTVQGGTIINPNPTPAAPPPAQVSQYSITYSTSYTSTIDGVTILTPLDINGHDLIGADIVQIEKEIKPMVAADWSWNKVTGVLTLLNGNTVDEGMTLFIIYRKLILN